MDPQPDPTALLAVAAVVVVAARQLLGTRTLGTFAPALLALTVVLTPASGHVVIGIVLAAGLVTIVPLRAARLPRVTRVGVSVALLAATTAAVPGLLGLEAGAQGGALPLVATVAVVEKAAEALEQEGAREAVGLLVRSVLVAAAALVAVTAPPVEVLVDEEPVSVALAAGAACAVIGCYRGMRLSELWRFRRVHAVELHGPGDPGAPVTVPSPRARPAATRVEAPQNDGPPALVDAT
jgi:hypothetical protein